MRRTWIAFISFVGILLGVLYFGQQWGMQQQRQAQVTQESDFPFYHVLGENRANPPVAKPVSEPWTLQWTEPMSYRQVHEWLEVLRRAGVSAYFTPILREGQVLYYLRSGTFADSTTAQKQASDISAKFKTTVQPQRL